MNIPSTTCVTWSPVKFRRIREVYWLEAKASVTRVIENVTPTTVIIEPAIVESIPRAPSAPAPNMRGQRVSQRSLPLESISISTTARRMLTATISEGTNQKLVRTLLHSCLSLFKKTNRRCLPSNACEMRCPCTRHKAVYARARRSAFLFYSSYMSRCLDLSFPQSYTLELR